MQVLRLIVYFFSVLLALTLTALLTAVVTNAQTLVVNPDLRPDFNRARTAQQRLPIDKSNRIRPNGYVSARNAAQRSRRPVIERASQRTVSRLQNTLSPASTAVIGPGTPLSRILHTSQIDLNSSAGTNEQFVDRNFNLVADERTTFNSDGGSFDIAVGASGARYEVYSATLNNTLVGVIVVALDTNGDYQMDSSSTFDLQRDFDLPSAAAVVSGVSSSGQEFVIVCSSGYYNSADPNDPNNEPSPGIVVLVRDPNTGGFNNTLSRELVTVGNNQLYNANGLALLPNNDLLIADFHSNELRIIRDTNNDRIPDALDPTPYYVYRFSDDAPLDVAANSRGVVFSHSAGDDTLMLVIYDDDRDGDGDRDEVVVQGLSIDNSLFLHGLTIDRTGNIYVIEDASGSTDQSNGGLPRIDAFPDVNLDGFLSNGAVFAEADDSSTLGLTGLSFGLTPLNPINEAQFFVRQHYLDFLGREPDPGGLNYWTSEITACGNAFNCLTSRRTGVSAAFYVEQEFQNTGSFVYRLYKGGLGRRPNYAEFSQDRSQVVELNLEETKRAFTLAFVQRPAFVQKYSANTTTSSFVDALIATILQSSNVDLNSQRNALIARYNQGTNVNESRAFVLRDAIDSAAFINAEYNASFVLMQYFGYLGRDADQAGFDFWLNVVNGRELNNYRGMVCAFITSREYQERFGLQLARSNSDCGN
jgi:hypothetical protein